MTDDQKIKLIDRRLLWSVEDTIPVVQNAPLTVCPRTGRTIDPYRIRLTYAWSREAWHLSEAFVYGPPVNEQGKPVPADDLEYDLDGQAECYFFDPTAATLEDGKFPDWVLRIAASGIERLSPPVMKQPES